MTTSILDTHVNSAQPSTSLQGSPVLRMQGSGGTTAFPYLLPKGFATGKDVLTLDAYIEITTQGAWGACTLRARRVTSSKAYSALNFNNQPSNTATGQTTQALGALAAGTKIRIDVTEFVDQWARGQVENYGIRLDAGATADKRIYSANAVAPHADDRPRLVVVQGRKPTKPQILGPKGGSQVSLTRPKLTWVPPADPLMAQASYRVEMNQDVDDFSSPDYDSGWVSSAAGEHLVTFDLDDGESWFWRLTIRNAAEQESTVTPGQEFGRTDKPTFSITQPTGGTWTDSTPPVEWSALSAGTQTQFQVQHLVDGKVVVDSGILAGDDTSWTYFKPIPGFSSGEVTTRVRVRDDVARIATPGDGVWIVREETWEYTPGATDPFETINVTKHPDWPVPVVTATRASTPDRIDWQRSVDAGPWQSVAVEEGADAHTVDDEYEFIDVTAPPGHDVAYRAVAGSNGIDSSDNPSDSITIKSTLIWLLDTEDDLFWVALNDRDEAGLRYTEDSEAFYPKGAQFPSVVFDAFRGWEGTVTGGVYGTDSSPHLGRTAVEMRDAFITRVKTNPTGLLRLILSDQNIPVIVRNATPILRPKAQVSFGISFDAVQQGELPWS